MYMCIHLFLHTANIPPTSVFDNLGIATVVVIALALVFALGVCVLSLVVICLCCCVCKQRRRSKGISSSGLGVHFQAMNGNSAEGAYCVSCSGHFVFLLQFIAETPVIFICFLCIAV